MAVTTTTEHRRHLTVPVNSSGRRPRNISSGPSSIVSVPFDATSPPARPTCYLEDFLAAAQQRCQHFEQHISTLQDILDHEFDTWRTALREYERVNEELGRLSDMVLRTNTRDVRDALARSDAAFTDTLGVNSQLEGMCMRISDTENRLRDGQRKMERLEAVLAAQEAGRGWLTWTNIVIGIATLVVITGLILAIFVLRRES